MLYFLSASYISPMASMTVVVSKFMHFNELVFDVSFVVIPIVSICAYNQWNLNTFAQCGFNLRQNEFDVTFKILDIFKVANINICCIGSVPGQNRDSQLSLFIGLELL